MNIVKTGDTLRIYGSEIETLGSIPAKTYSIGFSKMGGFFLIEHNDLSVKEKIYGKMNSKIDKIFNSYKISDRNFGIILSGKKGSGKSMFARAISEAGINQYGLPTILVDTYIPGIASFLESIEQEVIIIFDEFEKTFAKNDDNNPQNDLLSLFDGTNSGKKMFIITCNNTRDLNEFLINRPGRFHYHFQMGYVDADAIREYLEDKLTVNKEVIDRIVNLSAFTGITYDYLRALVFDLNQGYDLKDTLNDLNIEIDTRGRFYLNVTMSDGNIYTNGRSYNLTIGEDDDNSISLHSLEKNSKKRSIYLHLCFNTKNVEVKDGIYIIDPKKIISFSFTNDEYDNEEIEKLTKEMNENLTIESITLEKANSVLYNTAQYIDV